ncbi:MAG: sigma-70 family RNA polymerase sigma factor [Clostridia bacterium]|nr:sigma-70 family RNA polymerase sigma factor [Clostridia bacterium]
MQKPELNELLCGIRAGDKDAFTRLYRELGPPVFTIAWRILQEREAAEDVTQEVFCGVFCEPPAPSVKNPRAWLFQIARNRAIDVWRRRRDNEPGAEGTVDVFDAVVQRLDVEAAMAALPRLQREVVTLHLTAGLTFREIAPIVGRSVPATYRQYRRALDTLRETLSGGAG